MKQKLIWLGDNLVFWIGAIWAFMIMIDVPPVVEHMEGKWDRMTFAVVIFILLLQNVRKK